MSSIISGLNIKNIYEYDSTQSYNKYDIVDYQLNTGISVYPNYTGLGQTGISFWFDNDTFNEFKTNSDDYVTGWINKINNEINLYQNDFELTPYIDFNYNYLNLVGEQFLSGSGFDLYTKTIFVCFNASKHPKNSAQNILKFDNPNAVSDESGYLRISGRDALGSSKVFIDNNSFSAVFSPYEQANILTLLVSGTSVSGPSGPTVQIRQNGYYIGTQTDTYRGWASGFFKLGGNDEYNLGLKYYDVFCFSGLLSETELDYYEKYLFEKYSDKGGLYWAKQDVPSSEFYAPTTYTGQNYWTRDINELFSLSYESRADFSAKLSALNFGDGYKTNIVNSINSLNADFELVYDGLTDIQAKALITYFENTPEAKVKSEYEGYTGVNFNLFTPYKQNAEVYFLDISHSTPDADVNKVVIKAESLYASNLNYKGMFVELDEVNIRTYRNDLTNFDYHDVVYFDSSSFNSRGYYFYTGSYNLRRLSLDNNPTGANSYFTKNFYFKPDLDYDLNSQLRLITQEYKSSTKQYLKDGINYNVLEFNLKFSNRSNKEALAILKFFDDKAGFKTFDYTLPQPYNKTILVYCPEWGHTYNFYNNHDITAKFIEFKGKFTAETQFNTKITFIE
jgi:phage-related protein